jgi:hypothetical protein
MILEFTSQAIEWRGPAPFVFLPVPEDACEAIRAFAPRLTYGWGCIPAELTIGQTTVKTSLFPRNGGYLVPVKVVVQKAEGIEVGSTAHARLEFQLN